MLLDKRAPSFSCRAWPKANAVSLAAISAKRLRSVPKSVGGISGGHRSYREDNHGPGKDAVESLTLDSEFEHKIGPERRFRRPEKVDRYDAARGETAAGFEASPSAPDKYS